MGWLPIVSVKEFLYPKVVKFFYSNMTFKDEGPITTMINGVQIVFYVAELITTKKCYFVDLIIMVLSIFE